MRDYSKDFAEWRKWRDEKGLPPIYDNPADAGIETDFRVGQQVSFTNEYGVRIVSQQFSLPSNMTNHSTGWYSRK